MGCSLKSLKALCGELCRWVLKGFLRWILGVCTIAHVTATDLVVSQNEGTPI